MHVFEHVQLLEMTYNTVKQTSIFIQQYNIFSISLVHNME